jgi:hypothetical protein
VPVAVGKSVPRSWPVAPRGRKAGYGMVIGQTALVGRPPQATHQTPAILPEDQKLPLKPEIYALRGDCRGDLALTRPITAILGLRRGTDAVIGSAHNRSIRHGAAIRSPCG